MHVFPRCPVINKALRWAHRPFRGFVPNIRRWNRNMQQKVEEDCRRKIESKKFWWSRPSLQLMIWSLRLCVYLCVWRKLYVEFRTDFIKPTYLMHNSSLTNIVLSMSHFGNLNLLPSKKIQFVSWVRVLGSWIDGHRILSSSRQYVYVLKL
jgi:hypothetical protein